MDSKSTPPDNVAPEEIRGGTAFLGVHIEDHLPGKKLIGFLGKILIWFAYPHRHDAIKPGGGGMKVAKAIDLYLEYHQLNSQKKYEPYLRVHPFKVSGPIF
ncbi:MAG: hypothetical protein ACLPYB_11335 [Desulfobaccales bacterium]